MKKKIAAAWSGFLDLFEVCEHCLCERRWVFFGVQKVGAMTAYHWDGKGVDPNGPMYLCLSCAEEYREHWTEMWSEYWSDRL